jgi:exodeoxyribonuclease V alpha subunit
MMERASYGDILYFPIVITKNDYENGLYNGTMGVLEKRVFQKGKISEVSSLDRVFFWDDSLLEEKVLEIPFSCLRHFSYGFCLTVHKSQGSEFSQVALLIPPGSESFGREVLYTAATRSRERIDIFTEEELFFSIMEKVGGKISGISGLESR